MIRWNADRFANGASLDLSVPTGLDAVVPSTQTRN
jgi:hypothetical protein